MWYVFAMETTCTVCQKPKANLTCGLCQELICKACAQFVDEDYFEFLSEAPTRFVQLTCCGPCFDIQVAPELDRYNQTLELAKNVFVFNKDQSKETRLIKRKLNPVRVVDCPDHDEAILRLAFQAVKVQCNAMVDVLVTPKKVKSGSYQTTLWSAQAIPVRIDADRYESDRPTLKNPN
ncbi:MAG: hypothetical protein AB7N80_15455 [Bdellovibrionales bacterium]